VHVEREVRHGEHVARHVRRNRHGAEHDHAVLARRPIRPRPRVASAQRRDVRVGE
jgi:hypothetical protein